MKKLFLVSIVLLSTFVMISCEKNKKDTEKPTIKLIEPENGDALKPSDKGIHFEVEFTDNEALGSYKVNIHPAFDGHTHEQAAPQFAAGDSIAFEKTWLESEFIAAGEQSIEGKRNVTIHHHKIVIPTTVNGKPLKEGNYHFMVTCSDKARNETFVACNIKISYSAKEHDHEHEH